MDAAFIAMAILLSIFAGYVVASVILLRNPQLLHKKKRVRFRGCQHVSHRGGAGENLENTMKAFRHAVAVGTEMLEIDCHVTRDGHVVVAHDNSLGRVCGTDREELISDYDYRDLPLISSRLPVEFWPDHSVECLDEADRRIPLLEDVFEEFPGLPINIDVKVNNDQLIDKVNELIVKYERQDSVAWGNRQAEVCEKLYKTNPNIGVIFPLRRVVALVIQFYFGVLPFLPIRESFYEVLMPSIVFGSPFEQRLSRKVRVLLRLVNFLLMSPVMIRHLEARGIQTYVWVLNDEAAFEKALRLGVTGIMTDFPTKLKQFYDQREPRDTDDLTKI